MEMHFRQALKKEWVLLDDRIIYGKNEILLNDIIKVVYAQKPTCCCFIITENTKKHYLYYGYSQVENAKKAAEYLMDYVGGETRKKEIEKLNEIKEKGFRKRCKLCGKIFCYTLEDLEENQRRAKSAVWASIGGIAGALSGNHVAGATNNQSAEDQISRIINYDKCPSCGSRELVDLTDEDIVQINAQQNCQTAFSSADELKKFKELFDMGVITQEEFDLKKKQLLGL